MVAYRMPSTRTPPPDGTRHPRPTPGLSILLHGFLPSEFRIWNARAVSVNALECRELLQVRGEFDLTAPA
jgi:hypothetical protein